MLSIILLSVWVGATLLALYRVKQQEQSPGLLPREGWTWAQLIAIYSILETINFTVNHTTWVSQIIKDASTASFIQVLALVSSHALCYLLLQLAGRHWGTDCLRHHLTRVEWRTILGFTLFATLTDLVFLATDNFDRKDVLPMTIVQVALLGATNWRTLQQLRQIIFMRAKLSRGAGQMSEAMNRKYLVYKRHLLYHAIALTFQTALIAAQFAVLALILTSVVSGPPQTIVALMLQSIYFSLYLFWTIGNFLGLLQ